MKFLIFLFIFGAAAQALELKSFETDGCTFFFDKMGKRDWKKCCLEHDIKYYIGGTKKRKKSVDRELKSCVKEAGGDFWAFIMHSGVKIGHLSPVKSKYAWNRSWNKSREKFADVFTEDEKELIYRRLIESPIDPVIWNPILNEIETREI